MTQLTPEEVEMIEQEAEEYSSYYSVEDSVMAFATYKETATKYLLQLKAERERAGKLLEALESAVSLLELPSNEVTKADIKEIETAINEYNNKP